MDESGEQFVAYFLPTDETMVKRAEDMLKERDYDEEGEYEYKMFRSVLVYFIFLFSIFPCMFLHCTSHFIQLICNHIRVH